MRRIPLLVTVLVVACGGQGASTTTTAATTTTSTTSAPTTTTTTLPPATTTTEPGYDWVYADEADMPTVVLVDPGEMPHTIHEYTLEVGSVHTALMRLELFISQTSNEQMVEITSAIEIEMTVEVLEATDEGFVVSSTFGEATVSSSDPFTEVTLESTYREIQGISLVQLIAPDGGILATSGQENIPGIGVVGGTEALSAATSRLPAEPFGVGAVWEVSTVLEDGNLVVLQTARFEVVAIDGPLISLTVVTAQELGPDGFVIPGVDPDSVEVEFDTQSTGDTVLDLGSPTPLTARSDTSQELIATRTLPEGTEQLIQILELVFEISR